MKTTNQYALIFILVGVAACGGQKPEPSQLEEAWNNANAPENMGVDASVHFDSLPRSAYLEGASAPWSGDYWATYKGGISQRWQNGDLGAHYARYRYAPLSPSQLQQLSNADLNRLSPAEKLDLYLGRLDMPLARAEQSRMESTAAENGGRVPTWFGLCHGWAAAAYMEKEPLNAVTVPLRDQRSLSFDPSDLKALITYAYAHADVEAEFIGTRCDGASRRFPFFGGRWAQPNCRDTNAGAFHLAVTEYIGRRGESFVAEMDRDKEVWNHPVIGYRFAYGRARRVGPFARRFERMDPRAAFVVPVTMILDYVVETEAGAEPGQPAVKERELRYEIEVTQNGRIVGGKWRSQNQPDFLWRLVQKPEGTREGVPLDVVRELIDLAR